MVDQKEKTYTITTPSGYEMTVIHMTREDVEREMAEFEAKYGMSSVEFLAKGRRGELECSDDFFEWEGHCEHLAIVYGVKELEVPRTYSGTELKIE